MAQTWAFNVAGAVSTGTSGGNVNPNPALPANWAAGDLHLIVAVSAAVYSATPPTGYTELYRNTSGIPYLTVWGRIAQAGDQAPQVANSNANSSACIVGFRGVMGAAAQTGTVQTAGTASTCNSGTVTTDAVDELVVQFYAGGVTSSSTATFTQASGTSLAQRRTSTTTVYGLCVSYEDKAAAGLTTTRACTTNRNVGGWQAIEIAFWQIIDGTLSLTQAANTLTPATGKVLANGTSSLTQGANTVTASGAGLPKGTLNLTQSANTLTATGGAPPSARTGTLNVTQGANWLLLPITEFGVLGVPWTVAYIGTKPVSELGTATGTLSVTQAANTIAASGKGLPEGTASLTQAANTVTASGKGLPKGTANLTQAANTLTASGVASVRHGTLSLTQAAGTLSASGQGLPKGTLSLTQAANTVSASGKGLPEGTASLTQAANTLTASGVASVRHGTFTATQGANTLSATGLALSGAVATLSLTQAANTLSASGKGLPKATASLTQQPDTVSGAGKVLVKGTLAATQTADTLTASGGRPGISGTLAVTQTAQTLTASCRHLTLVTASIDQAANTLAASGKALATGTATAAQVADTLTATGAVIVSGTLDVTQAADTLVASESLPGINGTLEATQEPDSLSGEGTVSRPPAEGGGLYFWPAQKKPAGKRPLVEPREAESRWRFAAADVEQEPQTLTARGNSVPGARGKSFFEAKPPEPVKKPSPPSLAPPAAARSLTPLSPEGGGAVTEGAAPAAPIAEPPAPTVAETLPAAPWPPPLAPRRPAVLGSPPVLGRLPATLSAPRRGSLAAMQVADGLVAAGVVDWSDVIAEEDQLFTIEDWKMYALMNRLRRSA